MGKDSVNPEPGPGEAEKRVLPYGQEQPEPIGGNVATGCVMALFFFMPIYLAAESGGVGAPGGIRQGSFFFLALTCMGFLYLAARHLESQGRRGVMVGAAAMTGACVLAAGLCFGAFS
jgi:hypothetical protein